MNDKFCMPPEWEPHDRCWMAWPSRDGLWSNIAGTRQIYTDIAHAIRRFEPVTMLVPPQLSASARDCLGSDIDILEMPIDDSWARDSGPNFVVSQQGKLAGVAFRFNAWGEKYHPYDQDAKMARRILKHIDVPCIESELTAEGGGLCVDGEGTLLTTDTCFPNVNRNPDWSRVQIETELKRTLGAEKVLWLPGDPLDDETDGHVDGIATIVRPGVVLVESTADPSDLRKPYFDSVRRVLEQSTDAHGRAFELLELPEARDANTQGDRFCRSYVNFYFANGAIIAPAYGIAADDQVQERLQSIFPEREIVLVRIDHIAEGGGGIHCITQQQPRSSP